LPEFSQPGLRIAAIKAHRILLRDGVPVAALKAGQLIPMDEKMELDHSIERALRSEIFLPFSDSITPIGDNGLAVNS